MKTNLKSIVKILVCSMLVIALSLGGTACREGGEKEPPTNTKITSSVESAPSEITSELPMGSLDESTNSEEWIIDFPTESYPNSYVEPVPDLGDGFVDLDGVIGDAPTASFENGWLPDNGGINTESYPYTDFNSYPDAGLNGGNNAGFNDQQISSDMVSAPDWNVNSEAVSTPNWNVNSEVASTPDWNVNSEVASTPDWNVNSEVASTPDSNLNSDPGLGTDPDLDNIPDTDPDLDGEDDFDFDFDFDFDIDFDDTEYTNPIQMYGTAVDGNDRDINIDVDEVVHEDFIGFGDHVFVVGLADEFKEEIGYNEAFFELDMTRANVMNSNLARMWFQVDWVVTDTEKNHAREDFENNKDYKNYINGVYSFDNDIMNSVYTYVDRYKEIGTDIALNFGWKHETRIHTWFSQPTANPRQAAPYDPEAFVNAAVATVQEFHRRGLSNVTYLTYYNEPDNGGDFETIGDSPSYWAVIARLTREKLDETGLSDKITFMGPEGCNFWRNWHSYLDKFTAAEGVNEAMDYYSVHHYYKTEYGDNNYQILFEDMLYFQNRYDKRMVISEMSATEVGCTDKNDAYFYHKDWNDTYTSYIIACANVGVKGVLSWGFGGGYTGNRLGGGWQGQYVYDATKNSVNEIGPVAQEYAECGLMTNYIDRDSDVLMVDWTGDDIRSAVFKAPDGSYTIIVDTKGGDKDLDLNFKFSESLNTTFYKFMFDRDADVTYNALLPFCMDEIKVGDSFSDTVDKKEAMYIYTTKKPRNQISLNSVGEKLAVGDTFDFDAELFDCPEGAKVEWSISAATGKKGSIDEKGIYTPDASARKGEFVAVRATLSTDKNIYATALVEIR